MIASVSLTSFAFLAASAPAFARVQSRASTSQSLISDINVISRYWGQISPYADNPDDYFGVNDVGLPDGCQVEQVHTLQRHANRFPGNWVSDGLVDLNFAAKVNNYTAANNGSFTGPLAFLNSYEYIMSSSLLTGLGAATEFSAGVSFWNRYGRTLYDAAPGQLAYNASYTNGTARPKPVLRTTDQSRIHNSQINWALGFFGSSFEAIPNPTLANSTDPFDVVIIPEGGTENNTLAAYDSCFNDYVSGIGDLGDIDLFHYIPRYLSNATARLQAYAPSGFTLTTNDTYAMQSICAYENGYIGMSDFCGLFTEDEWAGYENTLDIGYYYDYGYGNPTGRAQGIGYLQELLARLTNEYIPASNTSVNSTITNNPTTFPLNRPFYADFSHDDIIISVMAAMSLDYFHEAPTLTQFPPNPLRHFNLARITPFGARLVTEVIGCSVANPPAVHAHRTQYYPTQHGYRATNSSNKFIRMRLNNGILPLDTIRGGSCVGRTDGLCELGAFVDAQRDAYERSNYDYACFGNWSVVSPDNGNDYDGTVFEGQGGILEGGQPAPADD